MYSSMHSHIKKKEFYALIRYMHFHIIIHSINKNEKYIFSTYFFIIHYSSS